MDNHIWHFFSTSNANSNDTKVNDFVTLTETVMLNYYFRTLLPPVT